MKELRCIMFNDQETVAAIVSRRRRIREPLPSGAVNRVVFMDEGLIQADIHCTDPNGAATKLTVAESEINAALVNYCISRKIPIPAAADKFVQVVGDGVALIISINFPKRPTAMAGRIT